MNSLTHGRADSLFRRYQPLPQATHITIGDKNEIRFVEMNPPHGEPSFRPVVAGSSENPADNSREGKSRLRRACDSCSIRKVKVCSSARMLLCNSNPDN